MRKEIYMSEYETNEKQTGCGKHRGLKYTGIILATFIGSFLAFYFVANMAMNRFICPAYGMDSFQKMDREIMHDFREFDKEMNRINDKFRTHNVIFQHKSALEYIKTPDAYKFVVDLTPFQGNADAVNVDIEGSVITISGEASTNKNNVETFTKMSQTYTLGAGAKPEKLSKKKVDNKYIITVPIED